ncbi:MAG: hypothetical protein KA352_09465 [Flavobacteriales bacterium]|nr:hypothetical protein [Flavobacteriales bacterium]
MPESVYTLSECQQTLAIQVGIIAQCTVNLNNLNRLRSPKSAAENRIFEKGFILHLTAVYANALVTDLDKLYSSSPNQRQSFVHMLKHLSEDEYDGELLALIHLKDEGRQWHIEPDVRSAASQMAVFLLSKNETMKRLRYHRDKYTAHRDADWKSNDLPMRGELNALTNTAVEIHRVLSTDLALVTPAYDELKSELGVEEMISAWVKTLSL